MKNEIISKFREKPRTKTAWWAMGLGLATILGGPALGIFAAVIRPIIDKASMEGRENSGNLGANIGFGAGAVVLILSVSAIITSVRAYKKGYSRLG